MSENMSKRLCEAYAEALEVQRETERWSVSGTASAESVAMLLDLVIALIEDLESRGYFDVKLAGK